MADALLAGIALVAVAGSAALLASMLLPRSLPELLLATYVVGFGSVVALSLFLSAFDSLTRAALTTGALAFLAAAAGIWLMTGAPRPPGLPPAGSTKLASVPVALVAAVATVALTYVLALVVATPPNGWDQLNYHLPRASLWLEQHAVGYIEHAYDQRISSYPPNGEIGVAFVLGIGRYEVLAALVQLVAALACTVGVWTLARRFGLRRPEAAFGALVFLLLPIVLLQAATPKNDLVVASFLVAAAVFVLADSRRELVLAGLAVALAVGTKFTALYGIVVVAALAVLATPTSRRLERVGVVAVGAMAGAYWYALNIVKEGDPLGDTSGIPGLTAPLHPRENLVEAVGLAVDMLDLSGAKGSDILLYGVVGILLTAVLVGGERRSWRTATVAGALVCSPFLLYALTTWVGRPLLLALHDALGDPQAYIPPDEDPNSSPTFASDTGSWFGPVGILLVPGIAIAAWRLARRGALPRVALIAAGAPLLWYVLMSSSLTYHPWQGRFFLFPVALSAALWGLTLRVPPIAWAAAALAATTAVLSLVHYAEKPSGVRLLERAPQESVWRQERWQVQSQHDPALGPVLQFLEEQVPAGDSIALALGVNDFGFPAFGPRLERRVALVPFGSSARDLAASWLLASPDRATEIDRTCWQEAFSSESGTVFRRVESCL